MQNAILCWLTLDYAEARNCTYTLVTTTTALAAAALSFARTYIRMSWEHQDIHVSHMTPGASVVSGHDAGQTHYILILVCVCVRVRGGGGDEGIFPCVEQVCLYQYLCLVHSSSFLVMIIVSIFVVSNINTDTLCKSSVYC